MCVFLYIHKINDDSTHTCIYVFQKNMLRLYIEIYIYL